MRQLYGTSKKWLSFVIHWPFVGVGKLLAVGHLLAICWRFMPPFKPRQPGSGCVWSEWVNLEEPGRLGSSCFGVLGILGMSLIWRCRVVDLGHESALALACWGPWA
eukprot:339704-Chlamydomonas_euryale.AAC.1